MLFGKRSRVFRNLLKHNRYGFSGNLGCHDPVFAVPSLKPLDNFLGIDVLIDAVGFL